MWFEEPASLERLAGVDEVGRGPLAGPVVAASVIFGPARPHGLKDSKRLSPSRRIELAVEIKSCALAWGIGRASVKEIDELNILRASHLAMQRAVQAMGVAADVLLVDGNLLPSFSLPALAIIKGDDRVPVISAASIIAKVARDKEMCRMALRHPGYGLERHKGYATAQHLAALRQLGPTPLHRHSFAPVREAAASARVQDKTPQKFGSVLAC